jgi:hypothetical protein
MAHPVLVFFVAGIILGVIRYLDVTARKRRKE